MDSKTIVLIEDNPDDVALTHRALTKNNIRNELVVLTDGAAALEYIFGGEGQHLAPALVLLDLKLPKIDGLEVLRRLREDKRTRLWPVVILTNLRLNPSAICTRRTETPSQSENQSAVSSP